MLLGSLILSLQWLFSLEVELDISTAPIYSPKSSSNVTLLIQTQKPSKMAFTMIKTLSLNGGDDVMLY